MWTGLGLYMNSIDFPSTNKWYPFRQPFPEMVWYTETLVGLYWPLTRYRSASHGAWAGMAGCSSSGGTGAIACGLGGADMAAVEQWIKVSWSSPDLLFCCGVFASHKRQRHWHRPILQNRDELFYQWILYLVNGYKLFAVTGAKKNPGCDEVYLTLFTLHVAGPMMHILCLRIVCWLLILYGGAHDGIHLQTWIASFATKNVLSFPPLCLLLSVWL